MTSTCSCGKFSAACAELPRRVLVIDDEPLVRWALTTGLRAAGFDAVAVADGADARAVAGQLPRPDVVLLDAGLWDADPRLLLEEIRTMSPRCRFLILAVAGQEIALPPWDMVDVISKPFDLDEVVRRVGVVARCPADARMVG